MKNGLQHKQQAIFRLPLLLSAALALPMTMVYAQDKSAEEIAKYREALADGNPADLLEMKGESLWKEKRGPKQASLEQWLIR